MIAAMNTFGGMSATDLLAMLGGSPPTTKAAAAVSAASSPVSSILSSAMSDPAKAIQSILTQVAVSRAADGAASTHASDAAAGDTSVTGLSAASGGQALVAVALAAPTGLTPEDAALWGPEAPVVYSGSLMVATDQGKVEISNATSSSLGQDDARDKYTREVDDYTQQAALDGYTYLCRDISWAAQGAAKQTGDATAGDGVNATTGADSGEKYLYLYIGTEGENLLMSYANEAATQAQTLIDSVKNGALSSAQGFGYATLHNTITGVVGDQDAARAGMDGMRSVTPEMASDFESKYGAGSALADLLGHADFVNTYDGGGSGGSGAYLAIRLT